MIYICNIGGKTPKFTFTVIYFSVLCSAVPYPSPLKNK